MKKISMFGANAIDNVLEAIKRLSLRRERRTIT
jgi:hypothetical protein